MVNKQIQNAYRPWISLPLSNIENQWCEILGGKPWIVSGKTNLYVYMFHVIPFSRKIRY